MSKSIETAKAVMGCIGTATYGHGGSRVGPRQRDSGALTAEIATGETRGD